MTKKQISITIVATLFVLGTLLFFSGYSSVEAYSRTNDGVLVTAKVYLWRDWLSHDFGNFKVFAYLRNFFVKYPIEQIYLDKSTNKKLQKYLNDSASVWTFASKISIEENTLKRLQQRYCK